MLYKITAGGVNTRHPSSFLMSRPAGNADYLLLVVKSGGLFSIDGRECTVQAGTAIILDKHIPYRYSNPNGEYIDDWLHFLPDDDSAFRNSPVLLNEFFPLPDTERISSYIKLILYENSYADSAFKDENVSSLMTALLNNLRSFQQKKDSSSSFSFQTEKLKSLRLELSQSPHENFSASDCANRLGMSVSYFQHLYAQVFGTSFRQDSISMKIAYAKNILTTTDLPVETVANMCGYGSFVHFYRQFKKQCGLTPNKYRKQNWLVFQHEPTL